jgi:two-component system, OmpR family, sensor histidine kinase KdpD
MVASSAPVPWISYDNDTVRRSLVGSTVGVVLAVGFGAALVPWRSHVSIATAALVLVLPVVAGVITGGFSSGVASVAAGFVVFDFAFTPPYNRLTVAATQVWVALVVYAVIMLLVSRVVAHLESARTEAQRRAFEAQRLFDLSDLLVQDRSVEDLLRTIAGAVRTVFDLPGVTLLVPHDDRLEIAASAGEELTRGELQGLEPLSGVPVSLGTGPGQPDHLRTVVLSASGQPLGMLAMRGMPLSEADRALLRTFANHAALAIERAQLREQAMRTELLEEVERLRHTLLGAVSHDLRTPLATMKVASSTLLHPVTPLSEDDTYELHGLIDVETDRLTRLVSSLLDMTRIDAGVLEVRPRATSVRQLVHEAAAAAGSTLGARSLSVVVPDALPAVDIDHLLIGQVLANLLDNAVRHAPADSPIVVTGDLRGDRVAVSVADHGPGVPAHERQAIFDRYVRFDSGGRTGLGLTIAKTFVEAHGEHIWVEDGPGGGARFVFTLPLAANHLNGSQGMNGHRGG